MSEANWVDRASKRIDAWPVGPLAALMLGAATGFFCWAMPYSPAIGRLALIVAPALLAFVLTLVVFRRLDAGDDRAMVDEGDDHEDWLTRPSRTRRASVPAANRPSSRPGARPFIIDAIEDDDEAGPAPVRAGGWPLPLVDRPAKAPAGTIVRQAGPAEFRPAAPLAESRELLLDEPLPAALPIEDLMERLASRIEGREAAAPVRMAAPSAPPPAAPTPAASSPLSDVEALRAALADLHRMARRT